MKTLFGRGRPLLGAAAAVLLGGASTQQANAIIDIWEPFPGMMTSCSFSDDVDWSGTINFLNPIPCKTPKVSVYYKYCVGAHNDHEQENNDL